MYNLYLYCVIFKIYFTIKLPEFKFRSIEYDYIEQQHLTLLYNILTL